jgi:hypothetical protein
MYWKSPVEGLYELYKKNSNFYHEKYKTVPLIGDQAFISENYNHDYVEQHLPDGYISWTDPVSLNYTDSTGLIIFTSIKSKPSKKIFSSTPVIQTHWI